MAAVGPGRGKRFVVAVSGASGIALAIDLLRTAASRDEIEALQLARLRADLVGARDLVARNAVRMSRTRDEVGVEELQSDSALAARRSEGE